MNFEFFGKKTSNKDTLMSQRYLKASLHIEFLYQGHFHDFSKMYPLWYIKCTPDGRSK